MTHVKVYYALHMLQYDDKVAQPGTFVVDLSDETASFFLKNDAIRVATDSEREAVEAVQPVPAPAPKLKPKSAVKSDDI